MRSIVFIIAGRKLERWEVKTWLLEYTEGKGGGVGGEGDEVEEKKEEKFALRTKKHANEQNVKFLSSTPGNHSALKG